VEAADPPWLLLVTPPPDPRIVGASGALAEARLHALMDAADRARVDDALTRALADGAARVTVSLGGSAVAFRLARLEGSEPRVAMVAVDAREGFFEAMVRTTQDAFLTIDRSGRVQEFNPSAERMFGWTRTEMLGQPVEKLMPPEHAVAHGGYVRRYEHTGEARAIGRIREVEAMRRDGTRFPMELSVTESRSGGEVRYGAFIRDVSERERMTRDLVEKERLATVGEMAATLAHEVGNPLNNMTLKAEALERRLAKAEVSDPRLKVGLAEIREEVERLSDLLSEFRHLARRPRLDLQPLLGAELLSDVAEDLRARAGEITVEVDASASAALEADPAKLRQVLLNLGLNALEALEGRGVVTLSAREDGGHVVLEVADDGPGLPADVDPYEPFASTKEGGTGLGLAVARRLVEAHGGTLTHRALAPGVAFTARLPRRAPT